MRRWRAAAVIYVRDQLTRALDLMGIDVPAACDVSRCRRHRDRAVHASCTTTRRPSRRAGGDVAACSIAPTTPGRRGRAASTACC